MRAHIDRFISGIGRAVTREDHRDGGRDDHRRVRLVPGSGRPRRARATFIAVDLGAALAH